MKTRATTLGEISERDLQLWSELIDRAVIPYPFMDPRMLLPSARHRESARRMRILVVEQDDALIAVMPFEVSRTGDRFPLTVVSTRTQFFRETSMWDHPLVDADHAIEAFEGILAGLRAEGLPDLVDFVSMPAGGLLEDALIAASRRRSTPLTVRERREFGFLVNLRTKPDADDETGTPPEPSVPSFALAHTTSHTRRNYARLSRRLVETAGAPLVWSDRSSDPAAIDDFIALQHSGWKGDATQGGESLRVLGLETWFREVADSYRASGALVVYTLSTGPTLVHASINLRVGDSIFALTDTFNQEFAPFKAGSLGRIAGINQAFADPAVHNFHPDLEHRGAAVNEFFPDRGERMRILVANGGVRSRSVVTAIPVAREVRDRLRRVRSRVRTP